MKRLLEKARGLRRVGLRLLMPAVGLLMIGCAPESEPTPAVAAPKPSVAAEKPNARPQMKAAAKSAQNQKPSSVGVFDDFGLPLVIRIDVPEPPPEIQKSSPPIEDSHGAPLRRSILHFLLPDSSPPARDERNPH